jgi:hypothetical protein
VPCQGHILFVSWAHIALFAQGLSNQIMTVDASKNRWIMEARSGQGGIDHCDFRNVIKFTGNYCVATLQNVFRQCFWGPLVLPPVPCPSRQHRTSKKEIWQTSRLLL